MKRMRFFVIVVLVTALVAGGAAMASSRTQDITVTYRNIKMIINGTEFTPQYANVNMHNPCWDDCPHSLLRLLPTSDKTLAPPCNSCVTQNDILQYEL